MKHKITRILAVAILTFLAGTNLTNSSYSSRSEVYVNDDNSFTADTWELATNVNLYLEEDKTKASFKLYGNDLPLFTTYSYTLTYQTDNGQQGLIGGGDINGNTEI